MATKIKNILFPTDFSKNAQRALPFAAKIASLTGSKLILFHAIQFDLDFAPNFKQDQEKAASNVHQQFAKLIADLKIDEEYKNIKLSRVLETGQPVAGILEISREYNIDLIVMGTKGATGDRNIIFGSIISSIIDNSEVPVLAVPHRGSLKDMEQITFTTDYHDGDLQALRQTIDLADIFKSSIDVIHVAEKQNLLTEMKYRGFRELVNEQIDYEKISFEIKYDDDFFSVMANYFADNPSSMLVMVRYKKKFWKKMFERHHSKEMAFYTKVPLLVLVGD